MVITATKLRFLWHWRRTAQLRAMSVVRGQEAVHSDDGKYHIRLGNAITNPTSKIPGSSVAVFQGRILRLVPRAEWDVQYRLKCRAPVPLLDEYYGYAMGRLRPLGAVEQFEQQVSTSLEL